MTNPRFYTTTVAAEKTAFEIASLLRKYGARDFHLSYDEDGEPDAVAFTMAVPNLGLVPVRFRPKIDGVARRLPKKGRRGGRKELDIDQARRTAWRQVCTLIEMQLEAVENGVRAFHELFLSDIVVGETGQTVGERLEEGGVPLLLPGSATLERDS